MNDVIDLREQMLPWLRSCLDTPKQASWVLDEMYYLGFDRNDIRRVLWLMIERGEIRLGKELKLELGEWAP